MVIEFTDDPNFCVELEQGSELLLTHIFDGKNLILRPKITTIIELNQENLVQNEKIKQENQKLIDDNIKFSQDKIRLEE